MSVALNIDQLKEGLMYNFIPPAGEYPGAFGKCTLLRKWGNRLALRQEADAANPNQYEFDSTGKPNPKPRQLGEQSQAWVNVQSFQRIESTTADPIEAPKEKMQFKA